MPWVVLLLSRAAASASWRRFGAAALSAGLLSGLLCSASPFGIVFFGAFAGLFTLAEAVARKSLKPLYALALAGSVVLVLHLFWIVPAGLSMARGAATVKYHQGAAELRDNYVGMYRHFSAPLRQAALGHTDNYGMGTEYAYPVNLKETPVWAGSAVGLVLLALAGLAFRPRDRGLKWFAGLCLLAGFLCMAGSKTLAGAVFYEKFLSRAAMVFYLMARPARWLPLYYAGLALLAGMGLAACLRRRVWPHRSLDVAIGLVATGLTAVYLAPYWTGTLTVPKNATTQTMALMPQPLSLAEKRLAQALSADPADYRVTVWPTIAGPTGNVPEPPQNAITRNFAMLGKDAVMGPTFIGEPYSRFLLSVLHRPWPFTDRFGRLLGLAAVKRVVYDPSEPYLSYGAFGWMPTTKRGPETLFDPGHILAPFVAAQVDLRPDPELAAPPVDVLANADFLPRLRLASSARLAGGGFPLLLSLANALDPDFAGQALFFGADLAEADVSRLGQGLTGLAVANRSWPELLLPFLSPEWFQPAAQAAIQGEFDPLSSHILDDPRFGESSLDGGGKVSKGAGSLTFSLAGHGPWRLFLRAGAEAQAGPVTVSLDGAPLAVLDAGPLGQGLDWLDLGIATFEPGPPHGLEVAASGRGAVVSGLLAVPEEAVESARERLARLAGGKARLVAEAEEAAVGRVSPMAPRLTVPFLAENAGVEMASSNARIDRTDPMGGGVVAVEGENPGEVSFTAHFPVPAARVTLTAYPRLFGDKSSPSFVEAECSVDGGLFASLFRIEGKPDNRWEDVYGREESHVIPGPATTVTVRFRMRQAQLSSQVNPPNKPLRLTAETPVPGGETLSFGAAARLPAVFDLSAPTPGTYQARLRLVGRAGDVVILPDGSRHTLDHDGAAWVEAGSITTDPAGQARLELSGPSGTACDLLVLDAGGAAPPATGSDPPYTRVNPGRYALDLPPGQGGYLLFSEAYHPGWKLRVAGQDIAPVKGLGFLNAYPLPPGDLGRIDLVYRDQAVMERLLPVSRAGWWVFGLAVLALLAPDLRRKKTGLGNGH